MSATGSDAERLAGYVAVWWQAVHDLTALLEVLDADEWDLPTDLPGWDVRACAAHVAHLEGVLARRAEEHADVGDPPHARGPVGRYTEIGVVNRRGTAPADLVAEIRESAAARHAALRADPPRDAGAPPAYTLPGLGSTWETQLRNRPLDVWMHEQDVRRATGRPGGLDTAPAAHATGYLAEGAGFVLAKRAGAPVGATLVLAVDGHPELAFEVGDDGRGRRLPAPPAEPTLTVRCDRDSYVRLAGGRCDPEPGAVVVEGDRALGDRFLSVLATTP